jgi:hypothetical protein
MVRILSSFVVLFVTRNHSSHTTCATQNHLQGSTLHMSTNGNPISREDAVRIAIASAYVAWTVNSMTHVPTPTSALVPSTATQESSTDLQSTTAELLQSASALRVSVEERQLSMVVNGKAYSRLELQNQLDEYQKSYDELWKEVDKLNTLEKKVESSILFHENLMIKPEISQSEVRTLQQKNEELKEMKTTLSEKSMAAFRQTKLGSKRKD